MYVDWAVQLGQVEAVRLLLALPSADVSAKNTFGKSALSMVMDGNTSEEMSGMDVCASSDACAVS